jgi:hypothetical protein
MRVVPPAVPKLRSTERSKKLYEVQCLKMYRLLQYFLRFKVYNILSFNDGHSVFEFVDVCIIRHFFYKILLKPSLATFCYRLVFWNISGNMLKMPVFRNF